MHPDDLPSGRGLVPADPDASRAAMGEESLTNPTFVAAGFYAALQDLPSPRATELLQGITAGIRTDYWGDFVWARDLLTGLGMASGIRHPVPGVAYVTFVDVGDPPTNLRSDGDVLVDRSQVATLIADPDTGHWYVYSLGDYTLPEDIRV